MKLILAVAFRHLLARKRQSAVSLLGIVLGVAFFLAISSLMQGSEKDFIRRLVDNAPHITIVDEYRSPRPQPVHQAYARGSVELRGERPMTETRGLRGFERILAWLRAMPGTRASPVLVGQALIGFAGRSEAIAINGMVPEEIVDITTLAEDMKEGRIADLIADPNGIVIGAALARKLGLAKGRTISVSAANGQMRAFKVVGIFETGRSDYDQRQAFAGLKRVQALMDRPHRVNSIVVKLADAQRAHEIAERIEARINYKSVSWQEASEDILSTLAIRNVIMYAVVSAVLIVAAFGIYNVISTVVLEKMRDIAILKSIGFRAQDIRRIFVAQGAILGLAGNMVGLPLGGSLMFLLMQVQLTPPGSSLPINLPLDWGWPQFAIAGAFALGAAILAAWLPARKGGRVQPVDILRGGA